MKKCEQTALTQEKSNKLHLKKYLTRILEDARVLTFKSKTYRTSSNMLSLNFARLVFTLANSLSINVQLLKST